MTNLSPGVKTREIDFSYYVKHLSTSSAGMVGVAQRGPINQAVLVTSWEQFVNRFGSYIQAGYLAYAARAFFDNGGSVLYINRVAHLDDPTDRNSLAAARALAILPDRGIAASLETGTVGRDRIRWVAREVGVQGHDITVELRAQGANKAISAHRSGDAFRVKMATDSDGNPRSTVPQVLGIGNGIPRSSVEGFSEDEGIVQPAPPTPLAGGRDIRTTLRVLAVEAGRWGDGLAVRIEDGDPATGFNLVVLYKGEEVEVFADLTMDESDPSHVELAVNGRSEFITVEDLHAASAMTEDRPQAGTFPLSGGNDGLAGLTDADYIGDPSAHTGFYAFDEIDSLNLLMAPGVTTAAVIHGGIAYAEKRKDLMFLAEAPLHLEPREAVEFRRGQGMYSHAAFNSSYGALYYPWIEVTDPATGKRKRVPPSGAVAGCFARSDQKAGVWQAPAGIDRGRIVGALALGYPTSRGERDVLYPEGVNAIVSFPDSGIHVWGQKTLQSQPSALDRVNVRRLMIHIEEAIAESSRFVVFEPNNPQTWRSLVRLIHPFLEELRGQGGLVDFAVQCDEETNTPAAIDRNQLVARVFVKPTRTAEFIELHFVLTTTGADFREIIEIT